MDHEVHTCSTLVRNDAAATTYVPQEIILSFKRYDRRSCLHKNRFASPARKSLHTLVLESRDRSLSAKNPSSNEGVALFRYESSLINRKWGLIQLEMRIPFVLSEGGDGGAPGKHGPTKGIALLGCNENLPMTTLSKQQVRGVEWELTGFGEQFLQTGKLVWA